MSLAARASCAVVFTVLAAGAVIAQPVAGSPRPQPQSAVELPYQSTFDGYRRFSDEKVGSWREANDNVGRIGGWREYAKEAQQGDGGAQAAPKNSSGTAPAPAARDPHAGHGKH